MWIGLLALVLIVAAVGFLVLNQADEAEAEVLLESALAPGPDPFTPPIEKAPTSTEALPDPPDVRVRAGGSTIGLYGGTGSLGECDKNQLVAFLDSNPAKAQAWAGVEGISVEQIDTYVQALKQARLGVDTRVTNNGFVAGKANARQSVLQTGTAVLVDAQGTPRVRCKCGNPLQPPVPAADKPVYTGTPWPKFDANVLAAPPGTPPAKKPPVTQASTAVPTATAPVPSAPNIVTNGGFEDGFGPPWGTGIYEPNAETFWGQADADAAPVTDVVHSGGFSLRIQNRSAVAPQVYRTASQIIEVTGGADHCLTFWAKVENGAGGVLSIALNDAWTDRLPGPTGTVDWTEMKKTFKPEDGKIDVRIISENTGTAWIDDISVTEGACV